MSYYKHFDVHSYRKKLEAHGFFRAQQNTVQTAGQICTAVLFFVLVKSNILLPRTDLGSWMWPV